MNEDCCYIINSYVTMARLRCEGKIRAECEWPQKSVNIHSVKCSRIFHRFLSNSGMIELRLDGGEKRWKQTRVTLSWYCDINGSDYLKSTNTIWYCVLNNWLVVMNVPRCLLIILLGNLHLLKFSPNSWFTLKKQLLHVSPSTKEGIVYNKTLW